MTNSVIQRSTKDMPMLMNAQSKHRAPRRFGAALVVALAVTAVPMLAQAQRKSPLADAPAIRKRFELRSTRLEIGAGMGSTVNQDFYHSVLFSLRVGFHITDWLSIAGFGDFAVANLETGFQSKVVGSLNPDRIAGQKMGEPTRGEALASMQKINNILGAQLEFTPFTGKYSLFGKLFSAYDFYAFVGPGLISVKPTNANGVSSCSDSGGTDLACGVSGTKLGVNFGLGLHTYFTQWLALNIELRDLMAQINPSGRDVNADKVANNNDLSWTHTYMATGNIVLYLPTTANISP